jgi:hypothetical protein
MRRREPVAVVGPIGRYERLLSLGDGPIRIGSSLSRTCAPLGFDIEQAGTSKIEPAFWRKGMLRLFISHLATHKKWATELQEALLGCGISGFLAHNDIQSTLEWQNQIETALSTCDALVALLHEQFNAGKWTDQEIGFAMGRGVAVFSVRFGQDPYGFIGRFQGFNLILESRVNEKDIDREVERVTFIFGDPGQETQDRETQDRRPRTRRPRTDEITPDYEERLS